MKDELVRILARLAVRLDGSINQEDALFALYMLHRMSGHLAPHVVIRPVSSIEITKTDWGKLRSAMRQVAKAMRDAVPEVKTA